MNPINQRVLYMDYLRVLATLAVVVLHIASQNWASVPITTAYWQVFNAADSCVRWAVPIFVMISGALFLDPQKEIDTKKLYTKNILRMITVFIFWSALYAYDKWVNGEILKKSIMAFVEGHYHMWFIVMIIGLYILVPILRKITESQKITEYFLIVCGVMTFLLPQLIQWITIFEVPHTIDLMKSVSYSFNNFYFHFSLGYVYYFILGCYLAHRDIKKPLQYIIYALGILGAVFTVVMSYQYSMKIGTASILFYADNSLNAFAMVVAVFTFGKYVLSKINLGKKGTDILLKLSKYCLGIYLIHPFVMQKLYQWFAIDTLAFHPYLSVIAMTVMVFTVSAVISALLNLIPVVKKYIV